MATAAGPGVGASPGAPFANLANNLTSALLGLPASLQACLVSTSDRLSGATEYVQLATGLSPTVLYATVGAILLLGAIPAIAARNGHGSNKSGRMRRYGFSTRGALSPFSSTLGEDGVPSVTDDDFSYITSAELEDHHYGRDIPRPYTSTHSHIADDYSRSAPGPAYSRHRPEDDVMLIKHQGITYPEHFPAYSIGDGKLLVSDVRERVKMILDLSDRQASRVKLYYKGRRLRNPDTPVRDYGVKNNSEVLMILGDTSQGSSSESSEEVVVVRPDGGERDSVPGNSPRLGRFGKWAGRVPVIPRSPRDGPSQADLNVSADDNSRRAPSRVRTLSPSGSAASVASAPAGVPSAPAGVPGGPIEKLNDIAAHFNNTLAPVCTEFAARPPRDSKKRLEEHRKLSEMIMQQVLLKLDAVDTSGEEGARAWRKELVNQAQAALKKIDEAK